MADMKKLDICVLPFKIDMTTKKMEKLLQDGLEMMHNVDNPTCEQHRQLKYWEDGQDKLKRAGRIVHRMHPNLADMIDFAQRNVPEEYHGILNHAWSGIGDWQA